MYEFLEEEDDFEEFKIDDMDYDEVLAGADDVEMTGAKESLGTKGEDYDKKLW